MGSSPFLILEKTRMTFYYGGEDIVTSELAKRLINYCCPLDIQGYEVEDVLMRKNGEAALTAIPQCVSLGLVAPVICVFDSDGRCVVDLLKKCAKSGWKSEYSAINIAEDEGEVWLLADRRGFSDFFQIPQKFIPERNPSHSEISDDFKVKPSLYMLDSVFCHSESQKVRACMHIERPYRKPSTYNNFWPEFIQKHWDIESAAQNSESLRRAILRTKSVFK